MLEGGISEVFPNCLTEIHWHRETEHYFVFSGRAIFTVGDQEMDVNGSEDPTLIIIPSNVPHKIYNPYDVPVKFYYYFPGGERIFKDVTYFFPGGGKREPHEVCLKSYQESLSEY